MSQVDHVTCLSDVHLFLYITYETPYLLWKEKNMRITNIKFQWVLIQICYGLANKKFRKPLIQQHCPLSS